MEYKFVVDKKAELAPRQEEQATGPKESFDKIIRIINNASHIFQGCGECTAIKTIIISGNKNYSLRTNQFYAGLGRLTNTGAALGDEFVGVHGNDNVRLIHRKLQTVEKFLETIDCMHGAGLFCAKATDNEYVFKDLKYKDSMNTYSFKFVDSDVHFQEGAFRQFKPTVNEDLWIRDLLPERINQIKCILDIHKLQSAKLYGTNAQRAR